MHDILFEYEMKPTTWVYLSSLLIIGIYFKFRRFWSIRNLDLLALIALSPGLLLVTHDKTQAGYTWLFCVGGFILVRLLLDPVLVRRPLLEPNLSSDGLTFTGGALLVFLLGNVITDPSGPGSAAEKQQAALAAAGEGAAQRGELGQLGPGYPLFYALASLPNRALASSSSSQPEHYRLYQQQLAAARSTALGAHLTLVLGLVLIGYRHFGSLQTGVATATLYLLLPYTAQMGGRVEHVVPAALVVWAVACYRRPMLAGIFVGLALGTVYYPLFLVPLWCGFYWRRGLVRFSAGVVLVLVILIASLALTSTDMRAFLHQLAQMCEVPLRARNLSGFWRYHEPWFRVPVVAAFTALAASFALWPAQKNLGTLLSCSAAVMLGTQFWRAEHGGLYMAWYLPLVLLVIFRPNLEDRLAVTAVSERWTLWRKKSRPAPPPEEPTEPK